ncbi:MAG: RsmB/NOP family class I SAM-dependent RNA methyltransferase [Candidatus Hodarchaeota archaeon]
MQREAWMLAIESLSQIESRNISERLALTRTAKRLRVADFNVIRVAHKLVFETVRRRNFIDRLITSTLKTYSMGQLSPEVRAFLRLYVFQTRLATEKSDIDLDEAEGIAGIGRGILGWKAIRGIERFLGSLLTCRKTSVLQDLCDEERIGLRDFHPTWFVRYCFKLIGRGATLNLLHSSLKPTPTYIRINTLKASDSMIKDRFEQDRIATQQVSDLEGVHRVLYSREPLARTSSFLEGLFSIQDKASCFAAEAADPKPGMDVLDVCAAPGGKTFCLALMMKNRGVIYSLDYSRRRMDVWKNMISRMSVKTTVPIITDACRPLPLKRKVDVVVLDPPCTSTGAFGKVPSAKWRLTRRSIDRMASIQWKMLKNCADHVKSGGALIYSTCSITLEENEMLLERFLKWYPSFSLEEIRPNLGLHGYKGLHESRRLFPHIHECNGFFVVRLVKR